MIFWRDVPLQHKLRVQTLVAELWGMQSWVHPCSVLLRGAFVWDLEPIVPGFRANRVAAGNQVVLPVGLCPHAPAFRRPGEGFWAGAGGFWFGVISHFCLSRSRAAGPHFNLWLYSFARCDAAVVDAVCIANRTLLCPAVLVELMIRGFLIFSWADAT